MNNRKQPLSFRQSAARVFASFAEVSIIVMMMLILSALAYSLYLQTFAGQPQFFSSLANGAIAYLFVAALAQMIPIFGSLVVAEMFDDRYSTEGYVFDFLFDSYDRAGEFLKAKLAAV